MLTVPLAPLPNQKLSVTLANQPTILHVYQKAQGVFIDVYLNGSLVIGGVIGENNNWIIRNAWLGYSGDFMFMDTLGSDDPNYLGLGTRYKLYYLEADELPY